MELTNQKDSLRGILDHSSDVCSLDVLSVAQGTGLRVLPRGLAQIARPKRPFLVWGQDKSGPCHHRFGNLPVRVLGARHC